PGPPQAVAVHPAAGGQLPDPRPAARYVGARSMAYPPVVPPSTRTNATPSVDNHPGDHNQISAALTEILNHIATLEQGLPLVQGALTGYTTNFAGAVGVTFPIPFRAGTVPQIVICGAYEGFPEMLFSLQSSPTPPSATGFAFQVFNTNTHAVQPFTIVTASWIALGVR